MTMPKSPEARLATVCGLLILVTLISWWLGAAGRETDPARNAGLTLSVLLFAAFKVRVIVWEFMELRHAPTAMRRLGDALLALLMAVLIAIDGLGAG